MINQEKMAPSPNTYKAGSLHSSSDFSKSTGTLNGMSVSAVGSRTQVQIASNNNINEEDGIVSIKKKGCYEPDGSYSWIVLIASFIANLIADGCIFSFGVLYVELLDYFGESKARTAWVGSLLMAIPLLTGPVASVITNRYGCRKTTILGGFIASLGFCLSSLTNSIGQLCLTLGVIAGIGLSMVDVGANVIVAYFFEKRRAFATSTAAAGSGIGTFVFAMLTEWLVELYTWKGALLVLGGVMLNVVVCGALFVPVDVPIHGNESIENSEDDSTTRSQCTLTKIKNFIRNTILDDAICQSIGFIYFSMSCFVLYMWYDIPYIYIPDKASKDMEPKIEVSKASFLVSIIGIVSTVGQVLIGYLGDRPEIDTFYLYSGLTTVAGVATTLVPVMRDYAGMAAYAGVYGFFISANFALTTILLVELVGLDRLTSSYGLLLLVQGVANLVGPPIAGRYIANSMCMGGSRNFLGELKFITIAITF